MTEPITKQPAAEPVKPMECSDFNAKVIYLHFCDHMNSKSWVSYPTWIQLSKADKKLWHEILEYSIDLGNE